MPPLRRGVARRRIYEPPVIPVWVKNGPDSNGIAAEQPIPGEQREGNQGPGHDHPKRYGSGEQVLGGQGLDGQGLDGQGLGSLLLTPQELAEELLEQQRTGWEEAAWPQAVPEKLPSRPAEELARRGIAGIPLPDPMPQAPHHLQARPEAGRWKSPWKNSGKQRSLPRWVTVGLPMAALLFALGSLYWIVGLRDQLIFQQSSIRGLTQQNRKLTDQLRGGSPDGSSAGERGDFSANQAGNLPAYMPPDPLLHDRLRSGASTTRSVRPASPVQNVPPPAGNTSATPSMFSWQPAVPLPFRSGAQPNTGSVPALSTPLSGVNTQSVPASGGSGSEPVEAARAREESTAAQAKAPEGASPVVGGAATMNAPASATRDDKADGLLEAKSAKPEEIAARNTNNHTGGGAAIPSTGTNKSPAATAASAAKPLPVSSGVVAGNRISGERPVYPGLAKAANVQGMVVLEATITKTGGTSNLRVVSGPIMLQRAALDAVRSWRYKPYLLNGKPVEVETFVNVVFSLDR